MSKFNKKIIIIGAGPAGLTAAYELLQKGFSDVTVFEADSQVGGISRTIRHNGNRIDIGGHRFFSKSDWVMKWWENILPISAADRTELHYQGQRRHYTPQNITTENDGQILVRSRLSRIYYNKRFFNYPLKINIENLKKMGLKKVFLFGFSYVWVRFFPRKPEETLEDFFTNRFGRQLYLQFFKSYTEKVWGRPCSEISAEWGAQRVKSLSIMKAVTSGLKKALGLQSGKQATSLIEKFLYPKYGPGYLWEEVARKIEEMGGVIHMNSPVTAIKIENNKVCGVTATSPKNNTSQEFTCDELLSTLPIKHLIAFSEEAWSPAARKIGKELLYRDFITVGLLYCAEDVARSLPDNWIYIQEPGVTVGRVQVFNNWSPYLVAKAGTVWFGLEFFASENDNLWQMTDADLKELARREMHEIGLVRGTDVLDSIVVKVPKAYPGYFGEAYENFDLLRKELDGVSNLFLIGRNGMHRYNNMDHSMLTAKEAVEQIESGHIDKSRIWSVNIGDDYHEENK